jgi:hypothetical protein
MHGGASHGLPPSARDSLNESSMVSSLRDLSAGANAFTMAAAAGAVAGLAAAHRVAYGTDGTPLSPQQQQRQQQYQPPPQQQQYGETAGAPSRSLDTVGSAAMGYLSSALGPGNLTGEWLQQYQSQHPSSSSSSSSSSAPGPAASSALSSSLYGPPRTVLPSSATVVASDLDQALTAFKRLYRVEEREKEEAAARAAEAEATKQREAELQRQRKEEKDAERKRKDMEAELQRLKEEKEKKAAEDKEAELQRLREAARREEERLQKEQEDKAAAAKEEADQQQAQTDGPTLRQALHSITEGLDVTTLCLTRRLGLSEAPFDGREVGYPDVSASVALSSARGLAALRQNVRDLVLATTGTPLSVPLSPPRALADSLANTLDGVATRAPFGESMLPLSQTNYSAFAGSSDPLSSGDTRLGRLLRSIHAVEGPATTQQQQQQQQQGPDSVPQSPHRPAEVSSVAYAYSASPQPQGDPGDRVPEHEGEGDDDDRVMDSIIYELKALNSLNRSMRRDQAATAADPNPAPSAPASSGSVAARPLPPLPTKPKAKSAPSTPARRQLEALRALKDSWLRGGSAGLDLAPAADAADAAQHATDDDGEGEQEAEAARPAATAVQTTAAPSQVFSQAISATPGPRAPRLQLPDPSQQGGSLPALSQGPPMPARRMSTAAGSPTTQQAPQAAAAPAPTSATAPAPAPALAPAPAPAATEPLAPAHAADQAEESALQRSRIVNPGVAFAPGSFAPSSSFIPLDRIPAVPVPAPAGPASVTIPSQAEVQDQLELLAALRGKIGSANPVAGSNASWLSRDASPAGLVVEAMRATRELTAAAFQGTLQEILSRLPAPGLAAAPGAGFGTETSVPGTPGGNRSASASWRPQTEPIAPLSPQPLAHSIAQTRGQPDAAYAPHAPPYLQGHGGWAGSGPQPYPQYPQYPQYPPYPQQYPQHLQYSGGYAHPHADPSMDGPAGDWGRGSLMPPPVAGPYGYPTAPADPFQYSSAASFYAPGTEHALPIPRSTTPYAYDAALASSVPPMTQQRIDGMLHRSVPAASPAFQPAFAHAAAAYDPFGYGHTDRGQVAHAPRSVEEMLVVQRRLEQQVFNDGNPNKAARAARATSKAGQEHPGLHQPAFERRRQDSASHRSADTDLDRSIVPSAARTVMHKAEDVLRRLSQVKRGAGSNDAWGNPEAEVHDYEYVDFSHGR